jgi:hypothetical protein
MGNTVGNSSNDHLWTLVVGRKGISRSTLDTLLGVLVIVDTVGYSGLSDLETSSSSGISSITSVT